MSAFAAVFEPRQSAGLVVRQRPNWPFSDLDHFLPLSKALAFIHHMLCL